MFSLEGGISSVKLEGSMSACIVLAPEVSFLKIRLAANETKAGIGFVGKAEILSRDPLALCMDGKDYWNLDESIDIGPEILPLYHYEKSIYNVDNALIDNLHIEETGIVPKCTRQGGETHLDCIYQGTIIDSVTQNPINNITVTIVDQDNVLVETVYTNEMGFFKGKQLPPGKYTIYASSEEYELYESTFEIIDGQITNMSISLKPTYFESCNFYGHVVRMVDSIPIYRAKVEIVHGGTIVDTIYTDENGYYESKLLNSGEYIFQISAPGCITIVQAFSIGMGEIKGLDFCMILSEAVVNSHLNYVDNVENKDDNQTASPSNAQHEQESADTNNNQQDKTDINIDKADLQENGVVFDEQETSGIAEFEVALDFSDEEGTPKVLDDEETGKIDDNTGYDGSQRKSLLIT